MIISCFVLCIIIDLWNLLVLACATKLQFFLKYVSPIKVYNSTFKTICIPIKNVFDLNIYIDMQEKKIISSNWYMLTSCSVLCIIIDLWDLSVLACATKLQFF